MKAVFDAIMTKATGSTFLTACTGGLHRDYSPQPKVMPYAVMYMLPSAPMNTFKEKGERIRIQFNIYSDAKTATTLDDIASKLMTLFDDCTMTVTGYYFIAMTRILNECFYVPENMNRQYVVQYELLIQKT